MNVYFYALLWCVLQLVCRFPFHARLWHVGWWNDVKIIHLLQCCCHRCLVQMIHFKQTTNVRRKKTYTHGKIGKTFSEHALRIFIDTKYNEYVVCAWSLAPYMLRYNPDSSLMMFSNTLRYYLKYISFFFFIFALTSRVLLFCDWCVCFFFISLFLPQCASFLRFFTVSPSFSF